MPLNYDYSEPKNQNGDTQFLSYKRMIYSNDDTELLSPCSWSMIFAL